MKAVVLVSVVAVIVLCTMVYGPFADRQNTVLDENNTKKLEDRVAAIEKMVAALDRRIQDDKLVNSLQGKWIEESYVRAGERQVEIQDEPGRIEVVWNLAHDANKSARWILEAEPKSVNYGTFSVDTSRTPAWIELQLFVERDAKYYPVRGIVKYTYQRAEIAMPSKLFDGDRFLDPPRPTSFVSTTENGYAVHKLIRESYKRTGVW